MRKRNMIEIDSDEQYSTSTVVKEGAKFALHISTFTYLNIKT